jgi:hypothetical protein
MCIIFLCLLKTIAINSIRTDDFSYICEKTTLGAYYGIEIEIIIPLQIQNYIQNNPDIVQFEFFIFDKPNVINKFNFYTAENKSLYYMQPQIPKGFDPKYDMVTKVNSKNCKKDIYWMYLHYISYLENKQTQISENELPLRQYQDNFYPTIEMKGIINIPQIETNNRNEWYQVYNDYFFYQLLYIRINNLWKNFNQKYNNLITIFYL